MNKADKAKLLAEEQRAAEPGIGAAFATIGLILGGCLLVALTVYGVISGIRFIDKPGSLIGQRQDVPTGQHAIPQHVYQTRERAA